MRRSVAVLGWIRRVHRDRLLVLGLPRVVIEHARLRKGTAGVRFRLVDKRHAARRVLVTLKAAGRNHPPRSTEAAIRGGRRRVRAAVPLGRAPYVVSVSAVTASG